MLVDGLPACYFPMHYHEDQKVRRDILHLFGVLAVLAVLSSAYVLRGACVVALPFKLVRAESLDVDQQLQLRGAATAASPYQVVPGEQFTTSQGLSYQDAVAGAQAPEDTGSVI